MIPRSPAQVRSRPLLHCLSVGVLTASLLVPRPAAATACGVTAVSNVGFGTYNPGSASPLDALGSITYQCSIAGVLDVIFLELGKGSSNTYTPRRLVSSTHTIDYNLYLDMGRSQIWGDGTGGSDRYGPTILNLLPTTVTVFGRIPAGQNAFVGSYVDTIVVTANF